MSEYQYKDQNAGTEPGGLSKVPALHQASGLPNAEGASQTTLQEVLATVWADSLGIEKVGIEDDFFELGGASVVATQIVSRLRRDVSDGFARDPFVRYPHRREACTLHD